VSVNYFAETLKLYICILFVFDDSKCSFTEHLWNIYFASFGFLPWYLFYSLTNQVMMVEDKGQY
jgi:hypothetical protein